MHTLFKLSPGGISTPEDENTLACFAPWHSIHTVDLMEWGVCLRRAIDEDINISSDQPAETYALIVRAMGGEPC